MDSERYESYWREYEVLDAWWAANALKFPSVDPLMLEISIYDCVYYISHYDIATDDYLELAEIGCDMAWAMLPVMQPPPSAANEGD